MEKAGCLVDTLSSSKSERVALGTPVGGSHFPSACFHGHENLKLKFSAITLFWN